MELGHWVSGSMSHLGHLSRPGHWVTGSSFWPGVNPSFSGFRKNAQNAKRIFEMLKWQKSCQVSVVGLKSLDVSPCNEVLLLPMIIKNSSAWEYFFVTSMTSLLDIIEQGHRVNWVSGSLDSRVTGSLGHKMWPSSMSVQQRIKKRRPFIWYDTTYFKVCQELTDSQIDLSLM